MNWALTQPRTLLAGGALFVLAALGGVAIGMASQDGTGVATSAADGTTAADAPTGSSAPPVTPRTEALVPVFGPVAEGVLPPASTGTPPPTPAGDDTADEPDDTPRTDAEPTATTEPTTGQGTAALRSVDFADGYEARGQDVPLLEPAGPEDTATEDADVLPGSPTEAPSGGAGGDGTDIAGEEGGADADEPALVDLCAGDEPVEGCDEGVLGTIWFAAVVPVTIDDVAVYRTVPPECASGSAVLADADVALMVTTNQPVSLAVSWDYGVDGVTGSTTGTTDTDQAASFDRGERDSVVTCVAVAGPSSVSRTRPIVRIQATASDGGDPALWEQPVELGVAIVAGDVTRPDRPPLRIEWRGARQVEVWAPVGPDETAVAWLVRRDPDRPSVSRCRAAEDGLLSGSEAIASPPIGRRALARSPGTDHGFTSLLQFGLSSFEAGQHDVCVRWQEGPDPAPVTERAAVQVRFDELPRVEVLLAGASTSAPQPNSITVGVSCGTRTWPLAEFNSADEITPRVLCEETLGSVVGGRVAIAHRVDWGPQPGETADGLLRLLVTGCDATDLPACTRWYRLPLLGSDGEVRGELTVGLRPVSVPEVAWRPRTGPERAYGQPEPEPDHPRLEPRSTVLEPDPSSPTDTLRLRLRTVDPADVEAQLFVGDRRAEGAHCATRSPRATAAGAQDGATLVFDELCPGTRYRAVVTVRAPGDASRAAVYGGDPATHDVPVRPLDATGSTDPLRLEISATLEISHIGGSGDRASYVIPSIVRLRAGPEISSFTQDYLGRARMGMWCGHVSGLGQQIEPTVVDLGATLHLHAYARLHHWNPRGVPCPGIEAQINQAPAPADPDFGDSGMILPAIRRTHTQDLTQWIDTQSLRPGTYTFETSYSDGNAFRFDVTLTVHEVTAD